MISDDILKSLHKKNRKNEFAVMSSSPSAPYFHFVQFKRFMAPRAAKS